MSQSKIYTTVMDYIYHRMNIIPFCDVSEDDKSYRVFVYYKQKVCGVTEKDVSSMVYIRKKDFEQEIDKKCEILCNMLSDKLSEN